MRLLQLSLVLATTVLLSLGGCKSTSSTTQPALVPAAVSPIADIPVPAGFKVEGQPRSDVIPGTNLRFVNYSFKGDDDLAPVVRFYRDEMQKKGWNFLSQHQVGDEVTLNFSKNNEDTVVTVRLGTFDTHINIRLAPSARNAMK